MASRRKYPAWTPERRRRFAATMRAKRAGATPRHYFRKGGAQVQLHPEGAKLKRGFNQRDAIIFLRHARADIVDRMKSGALKSPDQAHLYTLLALAVLSGEAL